jgi:hypothetical protein
MACMQAVKDRKMAPKIESWLAARSRLFHVRGSRTWVCPRKRALLQASAAKCK